MDVVATVVLFGSREYVRQTISAQFAAISVQPLPHGACCSEALDSAIVNPRTLFRIGVIRITLGVVRHMALEKRNGNCFW